MNASTQPMENEIQTLLREADLYQAMGLYEESLKIYTKLISRTGDLNPELQKEILQRISIARHHLHEIEAEKPTIFSTKELSILQQSQATEETVPDMLESGQALVDLGLFKEAASEYQKAFQKEVNNPDCLHRYMECLFRLMTPRQVLEQVSLVIERHAPDNKIRAGILMLIGTALEKRDQKDLALEVLKSALSLDPESSEIDARLNALMTQLTPGSRYDHLINQNLITPGQLQRALIQAQKSHKSVESVLMDEFHIAKADIGKSLSLFYGCAFKSFDPKTPMPHELVSSLKKSFLMHDMWVPISWGKNGIEIIVDDPRDIRKTDHIRALIKSRNIIIYVGIREDIEQFIHLLYQANPSRSVEESIDLESLIPDIAFDEPEEIDQELASLDENASQVVRLVDQIMVTAYRNGVSDIHIEPSAITGKTGIRFRMDGVCQEYLKVPNTMAKGLLSRIKIMANLDISERRLPQDGKISFKRKNIPPFELRVATIPTAGGYEDAVLRILAKAGAMPLEKMALNFRNMQIMQRILVQPYGLILVVGPTGSGKTTTLHAALGHINKPGIKIWTAEDPVEITQLGLRQVEAKPRIGLDFARIMRSFLRSDPDVIMIGEMRDEETASIGVEASLTGHLVFSTLHTNSAPETVTRLLDMGMNPLNFSDAFLGVLAQRLVRTLCKKCRKAYNPTQEEFDDIVTAYGPEDFRRTVVVWSKDLTLYRAVGCEECSGSGYKGRMGIHELMEGTPAIKRLIKKQASSEALFAQASSEGMATLKQDAIQKMLQGLTDIKEVNRVCIA
ncbi:MAG: ATPase, T2SS/T4P/T4SS family [Desulfatirhabdiaceae bacterium]